MSTSGTSQTAKPGVSLTVSTDRIAAPLPVLVWRGVASLPNVPSLTWAGVRGGISVALALALPESPAKVPILSATYAVVLFSIVVQGLSLAAVARRTICR